MSSQQREAAPTAVIPPALFDTPGLGASIGGTAMVRAGGGAIGLMLQLYAAQIGAAPQLVGLIGVAFYLTELVGAPLFGIWVDRRGWRPFMLLGPLLAALAVLLTAATALVPLALALPLLFVTRLMEGSAVASNTPATLSFLSAAAAGDATLRARSVSYFQIAVIGGAALGGLLGGTLYGALGTIGFLVLAAFYILSWALFLRVPARLPNQPEAAAHSNPLALLRQRSLWFFAPAWIAVNAILGLWLNNLANQLTLPCATPPGAQIAELCAATSRQLLVGDYSPAVAGAIFTAFALVFSGGIVLWSRVLPGLRGSLAMLIALGGALLACALLTLLNRLQPDQVLPIAILCLLLAGALVVLSGFTPAALTILVDLAERNAGDRGAVMGAYSVLLGVGQFAGGAIGGLFAGWIGVDGLVLLSLIFTIIAGLFVLVYRQGEREA
jgi:MFS family permease